MDKLNEFCDICNEIKNCKNNFFQQYLLNSYQKHNLTTRIIFDDKNFFLIPSAGPISPCHLLLLPFQHVNSFAQLDYEMLEKACKLLKNILNIVHNQYGCVIAFEHGSITGNVGSTSCNHAHIHILALQIPIIDILRQRGLHAIRIEHMSEMRNKYYINTPYFFIVDNKNNFWLIEDTIQQSQYLRILCAEELGEGNALWQNNLNIDKMISTNKKFNDIFKLNN